MGKYLIQENGHYAFVPEIRLISQITFDKSYSSGIPDVLEKKLRLFMEKHPESHNNLRARSTNTSLQFKEGILEQDEKVIVSGIGEWKSAVSLGFPAGYGRILHIQAAPEAFSVITDDLKWMKHVRNPSN